LSLCASITGNVLILKAGVTNGKKLVNRTGIFAMENNTKAWLGVIRRQIESRKFGLFIELDMVIKV
jgi:hypothetical protein